MQFAGSCSTNFITTRMTNTSVYIVFRKFANDKNKEARDKYTQVSYAFCVRLRKLDHSCLFPAHFDDSLGRKYSQDRRCYHSVLSYIWNLYTVEFLNRFQTV